MEAGRLTRSELRTIYDLLNLANLARAGGEESMGTSRAAPEAAQAEALESAPERQEERQAGEPCLAESLELLAIQHDARLALLQARINKAATDARRSVVLSVIALAVTSAICLLLLWFRFR